MRWDYSFSFWPEERSPRWNWAGYALFKLLGQSRVVMDFTEKDFEEFRESLVKTGLTLREIERVPHFEPERVH